MKTELTNIELHELFEEQLEFLESSALSYDNGFEGEIKRLAITLRVLVHDTSKSTSLLTLIDKKNTEFVDTSFPYDESNLMSHSGLVQISLNSSTPSKPLPFLDNGPYSRNVSFDLWWNGIVLVDKNKHEFSRRDIVLALANKEGGAHVDNKLDKKYADLRKHNTLGWVDVDASGIETPAADQVPATMRQIAHEALKTLKDDYSCKRENKDDSGIIMFGASMYKGRELPKELKHNLPKNRPIVSGRKIRRNDTCPCGSGKKYKKCCLK